MAAIDADMVLVAEGGHRQVHARRAVLRMGAEERKRQHEAHCLGEHPVYFRDRNGVPAAIVVTLVGWHDDDMSATILAAPLPALDGRVSGLGHGGKEPDGRLRSAGKPVSGRGASARSAARPGERDPQLGGLAMGLAAEQAARAMLVDLDCLEQGVNGSGKSLARA